MPLTLELWGSSHSQGTYLIIDRNNLIVAVKTNNSDKKSAKIKRNLFADMFIRYVCPKLRNLLSDPESFTERQQDARHDIIDHLSSADLYDMHCHLSFFKAIDFGMFHSIFTDCIPEKALFRLISPECRQYLIETSRHYFEEIYNTIDGKKIEAEYVKDKEQELKSVSFSLSSSMPMTFFHSEYKFQLEKTKTPPKPVMTVELKEEKKPARRAPLPSIVKTGVFAAAAVTAIAFAGHVFSHMKQFKS